jgi:hypothetical protein
MAETPPSDNDPPDFCSPDQVDEIVAARAVIEQAKGVLMFVYDVDSLGRRSAELWSNRIRFRRISRVQEV